MGNDLEKKLIVLFRKKIICSLFDPIRFASYCNVRMDGQTKTEIYYDQTVINLPLLVLKLRLPYINVYPSSSWLVLVR